MARSNESWVEVGFAHSKVMAEAEQKIKSLELFGRMSLCTVFGFESVRGIFSFKWLQAESQCQNLVLLLWNNSHDLHIVDYHKAGGFTYSSSEKKIHFL